MKTIQLFAQLPPSVVEGMAGQLIDDSAYDVLVGGPDGEDTIVYRPDGTILFVYMKHAIGQAVRDASFEGLKRASMSGDLTNRFSATGGAHKYREKADGSISKTAEVHVRELPHLANSTSGTVGFLDPTTRFPYCRTTAFSAKDMEAHQSALPYVQAIHAHFARYLPDRHAAQEKAAQETRHDWLLPETCYTTLTVNRNWQTAVHTDKGDLAAGFGCMGVVGNDAYKGLVFVYPRFRIGVDIRDRDLVINDVHEWHANTPMVPLEGIEPDRVSVVCYYRERMLECDAPISEEQRRREYVAENPANRTYANKPVTNAFVPRKDLAVHLAVIGGTPETVVAVTELVGPGNWYVDETLPIKNPQAIKCHSLADAYNRALTDAFNEGLPCLLVPGWLSRLVKHTRRTHTEPVGIKEVVGKLRQAVGKGRISGLASNTIVGEDGGLEIKEKGLLSGVLYVLPNELRFDPQFLNLIAEDYSIQHIQSYQAANRVENYGYSVAGEWDADSRPLAFRLLRDKWGMAIGGSAAIPILKAEALLSMAQGRMF